MFDLINGLPVHPLVVHAVVVLLPLAVLGTIALAVVPRWRATFGPLLIGVTAVATALVPVATSSGEALEKRVGDPGRHAELGDQMIWFAIPLLVLVVLLVLLDRRRRRGAGDANGSAGSGKGLVTGVAALAVVAAVATGVQVYRVGDSGARAVWGDQVSSKSSGADSD
ncbi:MAG: hypothetical protein PGN07_01825 [Aeromicrobium erythreum]